jgi:predicted transcriptional regulator
MTLREFRKSLHVRQQELAKTAGISSPSLCNIEYGRRPTPEQVRKLARALTRVAGRTVTEQRVWGMCGGDNGKD